MELATFTPVEQGDRWPAKEAVDRPLIVQVREHRHGIKTRFNSDPNEKSYKADGSPGVTLDIVDLTTGAVYLDVLWMSGAIVDGLAPYLTQTLPIKLVWAGSQTGGNAYLSPVPLEGAELATATSWATSNPDRFEAERVARQHNGSAAGAAAPAVPVAQDAFPLPQPGAPAPVVPPAAAPAAAAVDVNDPGIQALLAAIAGQKA